MSQPHWAPTAMAALSAAVESDYVEMAHNFAELLDDPDDETVIVSAALWWSDLLLEARPLLALWATMPAPLSEYQTWVVRLLEARAGNRDEAGRQLFLDATSRGTEWFCEALTALLILTAQVLRPLV